MDDSILREFFELTRQETAASEIVVMTGSLPPGCPEGTYRDLMNALDGKKCILDTEGKELELAAKGAKPYLIKPNLRELGPVYVPGNRNAFLCLTAPCAGKRFPQMLHPDYRS